MRADRMSAYRQWDLPIESALHQEWQGGRACIGEGFSGAARFASGEGRHGQFK
jgi:enoyl-CoA hydratase